MCAAQVTAMACLLLAGKVEESTKKMKDFMHYARIVPGLQSSLATKEVRGVQACGATCVCGVTSCAVLPRLQGILRMQTRILRAERIVLNSLEFDLCVAHPFKHVVPFVKECKGVCRDARLASSLSARAA